MFKLKMTSELKKELLGSYGSYSTSNMTLKAGVEESIRWAISKIKKVEVVNISLPNKSKISRLFSMI